MDTLTFDDDQITIVHLPELTQSNNQGSDDFSSKHEERRNKGEVEMVFFKEEYESTTNLSPEQIK